MRPFTPSQRRQNDVFLRALHRTGNVRLSAREAGVKYGTIQHRRGGHPDFASRWDIALVDAHARFHAGGGKAGPVMAVRAASALRTEGGEPLVVRTKSGRLQVRPAHVGKLTHAAEQLFLQALSATANVRLSAAAAGASVAAFYRRRRQKEAFAREWRLALETGYVRLEAAAIMAVDPDSHEDDAWRDNDPPPIPPMTASQALQLLFLHRESVRQGWVEPRPRRGESDAVYIERLRASWMTDQAVGGARGAAPGARARGGGAAAAAAAAGARPGHGVEQGFGEAAVPCRGGAVRGVADRGYEAEGVRDTYSYVSLIADSVRETRTSTCEGTCTCTCP